LEASTFSCVRRLPPPFLFPSPFPPSPFFLSRMCASVKSVQRGATMPLCRLRVAPGPFFFPFFLLPFFSLLCRLGCRAMSPAPPKRLGISWPALSFFLSFPPSFFRSPYGPSIAIHVQRSRPIRLLSSFFPSFSFFFFFAGYKENVRSGLTSSLALPFFLFFPFFFPSLWLSAEMREVIEE